MHKNHWNRFAIVTLCIFQSVIEFGMGLWCSLSWRQHMIPVKMTATIV